MSAEPAFFDQFAAAWRILTWADVRTIVGLLAAPLAIVALLINASTRRLMRGRR